MNRARPYHPNQPLIAAVQDVNDLVACEDSSHAASVTGRSSSRNTGEDDFRRLDAQVVCCVSIGLVFNVTVACVFNAFAVFALAYLDKGMTFS